ncbi:hypothetical protein BGZ49_008400 [Haplosporangium sp. Z 27]|nr:hypothetical protein BGZ49_008400 [Haplosporangium sp. Z 27]
MVDQPYAINEIKTLDECMLSISRKWSLPERYFHKVQSDQNSLTYLELTALNDDTFGRECDLEKSDYLHEFLLRAVHLKHLIACCAFIRTEKLDAFSQGGSSDDHSRQVWACRKLETLKIRFSGHGVNNNPKYPDLVIFGYLARVCPFLEHLHIHMDVALSEGMCLMSRLRYLKRLYIGVGRSSTIAKRDMEWLQPHMSTMEMIKYSTFTRLQSIPKTTAGDELDWEHFGKREDIDNCAMERLVAIQQGVPCCLPQLEFLNIYYNFSVFQNLAIREAESYLRKIRPRVRVHIDSRWIQSCGSIAAVNYP